MSDRSTADDLVAAFGRVYGLTRPRPVSRIATGQPDWSGHADKVASLRLYFNAGPGQVPVTVETSHGKANVHHATLNVVLAAVNHRDLAFPLELTVEKRPTIIMVDGAEQRFTGYVCEPTARLVGAIGGLTVTVCCPADMANRVKLGAISARTLRLHLGK